MKILPAHIWKSRHYRMEIQKVQREAGPLHCLIKSSIEEKRLKEGARKQKGIEERRVQLLETLSRGR